MRDFNKFGGGSRFGGNRDNRKPSFGGGFGGGNHSFGGRDSARAEMFPAVCDDCGKNCQVPFKPTGNKEIFCSDCFEKRGGKEGRNDDRSFNREERSFNRFDDAPRFPRRDSFGSNDREMFDATCDECGKPCKLPFKPSSNKPVFCSNCFEDRGEKAGLHDAPDYKRTQRVDSGEGLSGASRKELGEMRDQLNSINVKLEKIMKALNITPAKVEVTAVDDVKAVVEKVQQVIEEVEVKKAKAKKVAAPVADVAPVKAKVAAKKKVAAPKKAAVKKVAAKKAK